MVRITPSPPDHEPPGKRQKTKPKPKPSSSGASTSTTSAPAGPPTPKTAADYYVRSIPGLDPPTKLSIYAGHIASTLQSHPPQAFDSDASLYFLLAKNRHIPKRERLLIWLNGGPGCSSFDGALIEIGPFKINSTGVPYEVENTAWNEYANVLFLDQPAGTGFSYVTKNSDVRELNQAADQVVVFLLHLYQLFPDLQQMDTYIAGESYAGQYIPYIADAVMRSAWITTPLKGLIIGNGWISPREQYPAYMTYVVEKGLVKKGSAGHKNIQAAVKRCDDEIAKLDKAGAGSDRGMVLIGTCEQILGAVTEATKKGDKCMNMYDTTQWQTCGAQWPPDLAQVTTYLRREDVVQALHAEAGAALHEWEHCSDKVGAQMWTPNSAPSVKLLPSLLEKIPVLLYAGDRDAMCPGVGIEAMIDKLEWNGATGFNGSEKQEWNVEGREAGTWTTDRGLTYVEVFEASHMVPIDQPVATHDMVLRFMGVDTLHAAGHAAVIPSRIGHETEAVLGATRPDGSAIGPVLPDAEATTPKQSVTEDGFDKDHERLYGPRRTLVLFVLLFALGVVVWAFFRWRREKRRARYRRMKGKGREVEGEGRGGGGLEEGIRLREGYGRVEQAEERAETVPVFDVGEEDDWDEGQDRDRRR